MGGGGCSDLPYNSIFSYLRDEPVVPRNLTARPAALGREPLKSSNCSPRHCLGHCSFCLLPFAFCLLPFAFLLSPFSFLLSPLHLRQCLLHAVQAFFQVLHTGREGNPNVPVLTKSRTRNDSHTRLA